MFIEGLFMFFLELNCINNIINVTEDSCRIMLKIIKIKLDAQPGIAVSVTNFLYKTINTAKKQTIIP